MYHYQRLKDLRDDKRLTQDDIAKLLKTTQQQYSKYEIGSQEIPVHHVITLANFYNTSTDFILGITNKTERYPKK
ncbi:MAG: helix-turn-helix transcriptional regulator [Bacillota bacterium]|nr:helix-turn-helix transcriptional regulator [Bacillota bacterium]